MAMVYLGRDLLLERAVAIKVLREDFTGDPDFQERFRQEAKAAANLSHPNIVTVHDFGIDQGRLFIVMELVPGTNLNAILHSRGRFTVEEGLPLIEQACAGIGYAHRAGLVHCDVKPHNILITPDNRVKVTDFGIARALASIRPDEKSTVVWGSPQYFSPEQAAGEAPSPASDVYSLGIVMFFMLTGRLPFTASSATELVHMHRFAEAPSPRLFNPSIPESLEQVILKVLAKEPSARYRTADQLGRVLIRFGEKTVAQKNIPTERISPQRQPSEPAPATKTPPAQIDSTRPPPRSEPVYRTAPPARPSVRKEIKTEYSQKRDENPLNLDWITILLGLFALLAWLGLIPFSFWVYLVFNPPIH